MRTRSRAFLWVTLVFLVGSGFGATATFLVRQSREPAQPVERPRGTFVTRMSEQLDLDLDQKEQLRQILEASREKQKQVDHHRDRQLREIRRETIQQIRTILRTEQTEKLDNFLKELKKNRSSSRSNRRR